MKRAYSLLAGILITIAGLSAQDFADFRINGNPLSPEYAADTVVLRFAGEYASDVRVEGNWLDSPVPMVKREGVWELRLTGLEGDLYAYRYLVDGVPSLDPSNPNVIHEGAVYSNFFVVDGVRSRAYREASHRGEVSFVWYDSKIMGMNRRMAVYTPYGYGREKRRQYPVLYLLHDEGSDEEAWLSMGRLAQIMDGLIEQGRAVPMIVVMPNCTPYEQASPTLGLPEVRTPRTLSTSVFISSLVNEIIPFVQAHYRAVPRKNARALGGVGRGGTDVINTAVMYPDLFDFVLPLSCGVVDNGHLTQDFLRIKNAKVKLFWTGCGTRDAEAYGPSQTLHETLSYIHLDHTFYVMSGGRDWRVWRQFLNNFAPMIFKYYTD